MDYFIEQSEMVAPGISEYWMTSDEKDHSFKYVKSPLPKSVVWTRQTIKKYINKANHYDKIILHSFFFSDLDIFLKGLSKNVEVTWIFWGGDGYSYTSDERQWYLPLTWNYKEHVFKEGVSSLRSFWRALNTKRHRILKSRYTRGLIKRVNICATWIKHDYEMIRNINSKMKWTYYAYYTVEQLNFLAFQPQSRNTNRLWLGNSATDTNNHLDALAYLVSIQWHGEIVVPLSYGSLEYRKKIIEYGENTFGEKFIPIVDFISLERYHELMNSCGIVWMNHIRQQAAGNILAALYMGKIVIMNHNNNLYKTLSDWDVHIENQDILTQLNTVSVNSFISNRDIIRDRLSLKTALAEVEEIYNLA